MEDQAKTKAELIAELSVLRAQAPQALQAAHDELERRVRERTAALNELIEQLYGEMRQRGRAEEALRASEDRNRALIEGADIGIALIDATYRIVMLNAAQARLIGKSPGEMVGAQCFRQFAGQEAVCPNCPGIRAMASGVPAEMEATGRRSDGSAFHVRVRASPVFDAQGKACAFVEVVEDIREQKRKEAEIAFLAKFPGENPHPVLRMNSGGTILYSNKPGTRLLEAWGCRIGAMLPRRWHQFVLEALGSRSIQQTECACGEQVFALTFAPISDANCVNLYALDITDRKRTEAALQKAEEKFRLTVEATDDGLWDWDLPSGAVYYSPRWGEILGVAPEELEPYYDFWRSRIHPDDRRAVMRHHFAHMHGEIPCLDIEHRVRTRSGQWKWVLGRGRIVERDARGRPKRIVGTMTDISQRKAAEAALRENEAVYRSLVENIDLGISLIDCTHSIIKINSAQARMFGKSPEEFQGKKCFCEFEKRDQVCEHCPGTRAMATGQPAEMRTAGVRDDGGRFAARVKAFPLFGPDGASTGFIELVEDVTQVERAQELLQQAKDAAEAANRAKSEFLANMSHEIRTPMTAILGFSDLLMTPDLLPSEQGEFLEGIRRNGKALLELINDILDLSRIEAEKLSLAKADCLLRQILDDVLSVVQIRAEEKGLCLETDYRPPLPETIHTDPARLRQVLVNLLGNAVKFTEQGRVRVTVTSIPAEPGDTRIQFAVSDTGIGIPPDKIAELFHPFAQADGSLTRRFGGTGLGLAISKRLARALGGDIEVVSRWGQGSTFTLTIAAGAPHDADALPAAPAASAPAPQPAPEPAPELHGRVLLVEDAPDVQRVVGRFLRKMNLQVEMAENGQQACQLSQQSQAAADPYDLILMDIQMPGMNGYEAARWLRARGWQGPIIALTAHAMVGDRQKCLEAGCDDYLAKPVTATALRELLARYLVRPAPAGATARSM